MKYATRKMKQMVLFPELFNGKSYVEEDVMFPLAGTKRVIKILPTEPDLFL